MFVLDFHNDSDSSSGSCDMCNAFFSCGEEQRRLRGYNDVMGSAFNDNIFWNQYLKIKVSISLILL